MQGRAYNGGKTSYSIFVVSQSFMSFDDHRLMIVERRETLSNDKN